ncbi:MAG: hypothetical protein JKY08_02555 [Flavobacteriaceae bacterium]|nr:hypothetical protein [Flavobacteriaceae bacterium]
MKKLKGTTIALTGLMLTGLCLGIMLYGIRANSDVYVFTGLGIMSFCLIIVAYGLYQHTKSNITKTP